MLGVYLMAQAANLMVRVGETDNVRFRHGAEEVWRCRALRYGPREKIMETMLVSAAIVSIAEIGDKTQLLAIVLAAKFRRPMPILLGILVATLLNHAIAASTGFIIARWLNGPIFQFLVGAAFVAMAGWALIPDKEVEAASAKTQRGVFLTTLVAFFLVEIGDKTQIATSLLAAQYNSILLVAVGTTLGMMAANAPAVLFGEAITRLIPLAHVRVAAAAIFAAIGVWIIVGMLRGV